MIHQSSRALWILVGILILAGFAGLIYSRLPHYTLPKDVTIVSPDISGPLTLKNTVLIDLVALGTRPVFLRGTASTLGCGIVSAAIQPASTSNHVSIALSVSDELPPNCPVPGVTPNMPTKFVVAASPNVTLKKDTVVDTVTFKGSNVAFAVKTVTALTTR